MGGLGIIFEEQGLATTQISLIRIHSERTNPPRALWVPFELGRPLGVPNDAAFQTRVIRAALGLLDAEQGPLLVDYGEEVPVDKEIDAPDAKEGLFCQIDWPEPPDPTAPTSELGKALLREITMMQPWYEVALKTWLRTTVGPSQLPIAEAAKYLAAFLADQTVICPRSDLPPARVLKLAYEDLKAFYTEAITMQPGFETSKCVEDWLFGETALGKALWRLRDICRASGDEQLQYLGRNSIVPDRQISPAANCISAPR